MTKLKSFYVAVVMTVGFMTTAISDEHSAAEGIGEITWEYAIVCGSSQSDDSDVYRKDDEDGDPTELEDTSMVAAVNQLMSEGWQPLGGVTISLRVSCQAMIKPNFPE